MADLKELGQYLRSQREEKKISLEEVSMATKVNIKVLTALESGDEDSLPPKPFVRGFIQAYARYLNLDVRDVLDKYQKITGSLPPKTISIPETEKKIEQNLPGNARNIITVALIILTIIGIVFIQRIIAKREAEMRGDVQAITGSDQPLKIQSTSPSPSPAAGEPTPTPSKESSAFALVASPSPEKKVAPWPTEAPRPTPTPLPTRAPTPTPTPTPKPTAIPEPTQIPPPQAQPSPTESSVEAAPQEIIVEALDKVTLKVTIDNKAVQEVTLNADQIQTFKAKGKLKLYTPDGGAISIIHNGYDLGVPGNLGQPKTMVFPK